MLGPGEAHSPSKHCRKKTHSHNAWRLRILVHAKIGYAHPQPDSGLGMLCQLASWRQRMHGRQTFPPSSFEPNVGTPLMHTTFCVGHHPLGPQSTSLPVRSSCRCPLTPNRILYFHFSASALLTWQLLGGQGSTAISSTRQELAPRLATLLPPSP